MSRVRTPPHRPGAQTPHEAATAAQREILDLWFALEGAGWTTLVLAPAHPDGSVEQLAKSLASAGQALSFHAVSSLAVNVLGPDSARALTMLVEGLRLRSWKRGPAAAMSPQRRLPADLEVPGTPEREPRRVAAEGDGVGEPPSADDLRRLQVPTGQLILAIPSVLSSPLGIAVARAADAVVLAVELGRTRLEDVRRSTDAIGRSKVVGTCLVRQGRAGDSAAE